MRCFLSLVLEIYLYLYVNFVFQSAGLNSSPDFSHFVRYHADDYLYGVNAPPKILPPFVAPSITRRIFVYKLRSFHLYCSLICLLQRLSDVFLE